MVVKGSICACNVITNIPPSGLDDINRKIVTHLKTGIS